jgi:metallophosphoesterase superfamily enzyme
MRVHEDWLLLPQRLAVHAPSGLAVLADVHLGYSQARRRQGDAIPVPTVASVLSPLARAAALHTLSGLLVAGDLFETGFAADLYRDFRAVLAELKIPFIGLVPGNHDRGAAHHLDSSLLWSEGYEIAGWHVLHGDAPTSLDRVVQGHAHPAVRVGGRKYPCFAIGPRHILLPAFSTDPSGVELRDVARARDWRYLAIVREHLLEVTPARRH